MTDSGEGAKNAAALIPELLADGIRVLVYGGNTGMEKWSGLGVFKP